MCVCKVAVDQRISLYMYTISIIVLLMIIMSYCVYILFQGTLAWMRKLTWSGLEEFQKAKKTPLYAPSGLATRNTGAFLQQYKNLHFYYVLDAGHMVCGIVFVSILNVRVCVLVSECVL